jgi:hypothetical protein
VENSALHTDTGKKSVIEKGQPVGPQKSADKKDTQLGYNKSLETSSWRKKAIGGV